MMYLMMNNKLFILDILWKMFLLSISCVNGSLNVTDENTTLASTIITTTTTITTNITTMPSISMAPKTPPARQPRRVTLCLCWAGEVMDGDTGECQPWVNGTTTVPMELKSANGVYGSIHVDTAELTVTVNEPKCGANREIKLPELPEDEFIVRSRGDLLVLKGEHKGLRVSKYCIHHQSGESGEHGGQLKVIARGCVPVPNVPRCCAPGEYMRDSECVSANSTITQEFKPPLSTGPHGGLDLPGADFPWPEQQEHVHMPSCPPYHVMKKVKLSGNIAYLAALDPQGVFMSKKKQGQGRENIHPRLYCVDVPVYGGTYFAYFCQYDMDADCKDKVCTKKCCPNGKALDKNTKRCVPYATPFEPHATYPNITQKTLPGFPKCDHFSEITNFTLSKDGTIMYEKYTYRLSEFCMDNFKSEDSAELGALKCDKEVFTWPNIKKKLYPPTLGLSCAFLSLLLLLHALVPKLMEDNGQYQFFHAVSLLVGISISLILRVMPPDGDEYRKLCFFFAFTMQFAFLSAYFWINVMVFDMWRIFRNVLRTNLDPVPSKTAGIYKLYAIGGPLLITMVTMIVQFVAPTGDESIPWLVHPGIGEGSCWLKSITEQVAYYYGPTAVLFLLNIIFIGLTYHYIRIIHGIQKSTNDPNGSTEEYAESSNKSDFIAAYRKQFILLVLVVGSWITEILSLITPFEIWEVSLDLLSNLQGVFVFFVFLTERKKRKHLKEQLPKLLKISNILIDQTNAARTDINNQNRMLPKKTFPCTVPTSSKDVSNSSYSLNESEASTNTPSIGITELSRTSKQL